MKEGYVTFINDNPLYRSLLDILVESVIQFSSKEIEVFSINFDYKHSSDRVINKRINLNSVNFETICYSKIYSSLNSEFDNGIQLDCDFILTDKMDILFDQCKEIKEYPIFSLHPKDPNNQENIMDLLNVKTKSQPYVHATYLFSKKNNDFLQECYDFSKYCLKNNIKPVNFDETIFNVFLWKYCVKNSWINPYDIYYENFINHNPIGYGTEINFYSCHGCKDISLAKNIFENIRTKKYEHLL